MANPTELAISPREITGKATKRLRKAGIIPANIFGRGEAPQAVQLDALTFDGLRRKHHTTGVMALRLADSNKTQTALIRHIQRDPRSGKILHIDFFRVSLSDRITAKVPLRFEGTAPGVKIEGGVLLHLLDALEVECAAGDIVEALEVDISSLEHIDDTLHAKDISLPPNYTLLTDPEEPVVKITPPRVEAEEAAEAPAEEAAGEASKAEAQSESAGS
ncbi:MAG TPA: 50S ribosomal protein L25 [Ktedonobacteraceae bacterium]|nr:50S ribosomal protein L25 [Ktedonobacteraceae bacterium]